MAYGKRVRIANAITELRRPPSIEYSDHQASEHPSPMYGQMQMQNQNPSPFAPGMPIPIMHSRTQSQSQNSQHSYPGTNTNTTTTHGYSQSVQSSLGSPLGYGPGHPNGSSIGTVPESPATTQSDGATNGPSALSPALAAAAGVGLGIAMSPPLNGVSVLSSSHV